MSEESIYFLNPRRCENCAFSEDRRRSSWVNCMEDAKKPVRRVWSSSCKKWKLKTEEKK